MNIDAVRFHVPAEGRWEPAPQGSKKHVGGGRMVESSKYLKPWRDKVISASMKALHEQCDETTFTGPLVVDLQFRMYRGKTVRRVYHTTAPDGDKLMRGVFDGMTQGGLIADDSLIVQGSFLKRYADGAAGQGVWVTVHTVESLRGSP